MFKTIAIDVFSVVIACVIGIINYRRMDRFHRLLFVQLCSWLVLYALGWIVLMGQGASKSNIWVYNVQVLAETSLLTLAVLRSNIKMKKMVIRIFYMVFLIIYIWQISARGFNEFVQVAYSFECLLMTTFFIYMLYMIFHTGSDQWIRHPMIWSGAGLLIYFSASLPYFSLFDFLNKSDVRLSENLHKAIIDVVSNFRYLCLAHGFWLISIRSSNVKRSVSV